MMRTHVDIGLQTVCAQRSNVSNREVIPRQELMTCARETLGKRLHISNIELSETEKKNLVGIFINGANTLSLEENIKLFLQSRSVS